MNKAAIKNYAIWARVQLIESAKQRAFEYEITENGESKANIESIGGRLLSVDEKEQRKQLISQIQRKGYTQVMEEVAYTWFNRFIALRFMEVNGYLPSKIRVFTDENGAFKPEILKEAMSVELDELDRNKVLNLLDKQDNEALYKYLLITQCNALNTGLPYMFEKIANWSELLFPANLLRSDSVVARMVSDIPEEDWTDAVQIIGWMYQYYNTELKDDTFALLKKNVKISKERIPAATQLFTPDWIVRYMVENSLGRLWYEGHSDFDKSQWKYYLDEADQEPEVEAQLKKIRADYANIRPEDIKVIDPCMGSGHILVYAFDVLMQIYTSAGWSERDAAKSILENNLYGLDIDDRAGQLAYFAVMMKARKYSRRILNGEVKPNVLSIQESNWMDDDFIAFVARKDANMKADLVLLRKTFKDAKEYGSILNVSSMNYDALYERIDIIGRSYMEDLFQNQYQIMTIEQLLPLVKQARIMSQKYDVTITNPPYMGASGMSAKLLNIVKEMYPDSKSDLFSAFIEKCQSMVKRNGYQAMITQHGWMFLGSYEKLRYRLVNESVLINMVHLGARAFDEIGGEVVQTTSFIFQNARPTNYISSISRVTDDVGEQAKESAYLNDIVNGDVFKMSYAKIKNIPNAFFGYWLSETLINHLIHSDKAGNYGVGKQGLITSDNERFLRLWFEVDNHKLHSKWYLYNKGGGFRRWYGNISYTVNWENNGFEICNFVDEKGKQLSRPQNTQYFFREAITWNDVSTANFCCRFVSNVAFDASGPEFFLKDPANKYYFLGLFNSKTTQEFMNLICQGLHYSTGHIPQIPVSVGRKTEVDSLVKSCVAVSKIDWDYAETSVDFKKNPLI